MLLIIIFGRFAGFLRLLFFTHNRSLAIAITLFKYGLLLSLTAIERYKSSKIVKKLHLAIATQDIAATVKDYSERLNAKPCLIIEDEYALWRTDSLNISVRQDSKFPPGSLRHLGWEDPTATEMSTETDVNGILWERFTKEQQAEEIREIWSDADYV